MGRLIRATKWASVAEQEAALVRWPRTIPDTVHVAEIRRETGLSEHAAIECLALARGWEGDVIEVAD